MNNSLQTRRLADRLRPVAAVCALLAIAFYWFCTVNHICRAGHMKHPPYPTWHFAIDYAWLSLLLLAVITALISSLRGKIALICLAAFLAYSRSVLESDGGVLFTFEWPAVAVLAIIALFNLLPKTITAKIKHLIKR
ncbi:MAG: hypothetical protein ACYTEQ_20635 [Planctomycetota bacterium]